MKTMRVEMFEEFWYQSPSSVLTVTSTPCRSEHDMAVHHRRPGGGAHRQGPALLLAAVWEAGGRGGQEERRPEVHALSHHRQLRGDRLLRGTQGELP